MIEVTNLTRKYGSFTAVDSVSFSIPKGQIVGLLGHNGAGKTTTLRMLTGYLEPTSGTVSICGYDVNKNMDEIQEKLGYLSEQSSLYPEMPVWQYLQYVAQLRGIAQSEQEEAIRAAIIATDLGSKSGEFISTLSKGYRQRVGVAQAIIHKPEILVLDEPTNGLDPTQIQLMRTLIKNLAKTSTVILSTHIMQEVEAICDRVLIILNGKVAIDSSLSDLQHNNNITLSVKQELEQVKEALNEISAVKNISPNKLNNSGIHTYSIEVEAVPSDLAPTIARKIFDKGWDLYSIDSEFTDLETVFKELNSSAERGASHA